MEWKPLIVVQAHDGCRAVSFPERDRHYGVWEMRDQIRYSKSAIPPEGRLQVSRRRGRTVKKVNRLVPDVQQRLADRGTEVVERHLAAYGVSRAMDLPEEGKVRLMRDLQGFYHQELPEGLQMIDPSEIGWRGALKRAWTFLRGERRQAL